MTYVVRVVGARAAQQYGRPKANLKNETFYLKFIFEFFLYKIIY